MTTERPWHLIDTAPRDGQPVELGWLPDGVVEHSVISAWVDEHWSGYWTPTHWREPTIAVAQQ